MLNDQRAYLNGRIKTTYKITFNYSGEFPMEITITCLLLNIYKLQTQNRSDSKSKLTIWSKERKKKVIFLASNRVTGRKDSSLSCCAHCAPRNYGFR